MTLREKLESGETLSELERATLVSVLDEQEYLRKWARIGKRLSVELPSLVEDDVDPIVFPARPGDSE